MDDAEFYAHSLHLLEIHQPGAVYSIEYGSIQSNVSADTLTPKSQSGKRLLAMGWHVSPTNFWCLTLSDRKLG